MTQAEILKELKKLTVPERIAVIEAALHLVREDLQREERLSPKPDIKQQLATAAEVLLPDYTSDAELTAFTVLDSEDFYA